MATDATPAPSWMTLRGHHARRLLPKSALQAVSDVSMAGHRVEPESIVKIARANQAPAEVVLAAFGYLHVQGELKRVDRYEGEVLLMSDEVAFALVLFQYEGSDAGPFTATIVDVRPK